MLLYSPGPANYSTLKYNSIGGSTFVGVGTRGSTFGSRTKTMRTMEATPGPGAYNGAKDIGTHVSTQLVRKSPAMSMSLKLAPTKEVYSNTPGPGGYEIYRPGTVGTGHCKTLSKRHLENRAAPIPGPGAYSPDIFKVKDMAPIYSMPGRKLTVRPSTSPGPGTYNTTGDLSRNNNAGRPGKTMSMRTPTSNVTAYPGPGAYTPAKIEKCQPHAPVYSMALKCGKGSDYAASTNPLFTKAQLSGNQAADPDGMGSTQLAATQRPASSGGVRLDSLPQQNPHQGQNNAVRGAYPQ